MIRKIILPLILAGAFFSCKKHKDNITISGQGNGNQLNLNIIDTFTIVSNTVFEDSLAGNNLNYQLLGNMNDPIFGYSAASVYARASLNEPLSSWSASNKIDSAILWIPSINGLNFYGNSNSLQQINIYRLDTKINDVRYNQRNNNFLISDQPIGKYFGVIQNRIYDSIRYKKNSKLPMGKGLKIKLNQDFASFLGKLPSEAYSETSKLLNYFKGVAIIPQNIDLAPGSGGYGIFDFVSGGLGYQAKILLYYNDTSTLVFPLNGKISTVNTSETKNYPNSIQTQLTVKGNYNTGYTQGLNGVKLWIQIPYLKNIVNTTAAAINDAKITVYVDKSTVTSIFPASPRLNFFKPLGEGSRQNDLIADFGLQNNDGLFNSSSMSYTFTITREIQKILTNAKNKGINSNFGFFITVPTDFPVTGSRTVFDMSKTKLTIAITKLN